MRARQGLRDIPLVPSITSYGHGPGVCATHQAGANRSRYGNPSSSSSASATGGRKTAADPENNSGSSAHASAGGERQRGARKISRTHDQMTNAKHWCSLLLLCVLAGPQLRAQGSLQDYQRAQGFLPGNLRHSIYVADVSAHWIDKTNRFWYHKVSQKGSEFIAVDAEHDTMGPAFDHEKLAGALAIASKRQVSASDLPFDTIEFAEDGKTVRFEVDDSHW